MAVVTSSHHSPEAEGPGGDAAGLGGMQLGWAGDAAGMGCCLIFLCSKKLDNMEGEFFAYSKA